MPNRTLPRLGGSEAEIRELHQAGLWVPAEGGWQFRDWADYQPLKEDVEAERDAARERMKKVRAAKKGVNKGGSGEQPANVPANIGRSSEEVRIAPSQSQSHPETSSSNEEEVKELKRATQITDSFTINDRMRQWAAEQAPDVDIDKRLPEFIDYWRGVGKANKDWEAVWRNGMRKRQEFAERDRQRRPNRDDENMAVVARLAAQEQAGIEA
ncbi:hypothetical protein O1W71_16350 [Microbacterium sp. H37-C3]|uniref:hypothetical protein n=1 Tax=Microbacterium sp. H37-C3 TaxID=3004354 RepID=UPI0022AF8C18|nr:hypothetical protein [Microbacterium sp. H37-C3]MCZ4069242.1 hypothetical protein [Microbacterium sp. H37-C3]